MEDFIKFIKNYFIPVFALLALMFAFGFFMLGIEKSDILDLRYCPHCGVELLR